MQKITEVATVALEIYFKMINLSFRKSTHFCVYKEKFATLSTRIILKKDTSV